MSVAANQQRTFLRLLAALRPHWRSDAALPARIQQLLARERSFGSRDRRLYRELIYTTLRFLPWIEPALDRTPDTAGTIVAWLAADTPATARFRAAVLGSEWPAVPANVVDKAAVVAPRLGLASEALPSLLPAWFRDQCPAAFASPDYATLATRAPLWLRLQTGDPSGVTAEFDARGWRWRASTVLPDAIELLDDVDATKTEAFAAGRFEVQDLGSQLILAIAGVAPGGRWLDYCAGAGGKTLQLSRLLGPSGHVDAHDIRPAALAELVARASRAGLGNVAVLSARPTATYDGVLVDAPCSGSGTWRRAPHLKWVTTPERIATAAATQLALLGEAAARVRPGGRLVYATCSLSRIENDDVIATFLGAHPDFGVESRSPSFGVMPGASGGFTLLPACHDTDGFFVAALRRDATRS